MLDSLADGAQIHAWDYTGNNPAQQWDLVDAGNGFFKIRNVKSGKLLEVENGSTANNTKIQQWAERRRHELSTGVSSPGATYFIKAASGRYICVQGMGSTNGAAIIQYDRENNPWFKWRFESVGDGNYKLSSLNALTRVLSVVSGSTANAANTNLWDYNAANNYQKVRIKPLLNGKFKFYFVHRHVLGHPRRRHGQQHQSPAVSRQRLQLAAVRPRARPLIHHPQQTHPLCLKN